MLNYLYNNSSLIILCLASLGVCILGFRLWRERRARERLVRDACGLWRYHRQTSFERKVAYGRKLKRSEKHEASSKVSAVINFSGDLRAQQRSVLANLVDELSVNRDEIKEVIVVISSPGGLVSHYGHAFSQMERIRDLGLPLTVCIDVVAASGGYLMSLPANKILAAPFSVVGSVGVLAFVPNFRELLSRWHIRPRTYVAGRYKRTVSFTDDASPEEEARFQSELVTIHRLFLEAVKKYRPQAKLEEVETGAHWTAAESIQLELGLVDGIMTSHGYLLELNEDSDLVVLSQKRGFFEDGFHLLSARLVDELEARLTGWTSGVDR